MSTTETVAPTPKKAFGQDPELDRRIVNDIGRGLIVALHEISRAYWAEIRAEADAS